MKKYLIITILTISSLLEAVADGYGHHIATLDSIIDESQSFELEKTRRIDDLKARAVAAKTPDERYAVNNMIYDEYKTFNVDSAITYVNKNLAIARAIGNPEWIAAEQIKKSFVLAATGLLAESMAAIDQVDSSMLSRDMRKEYYGQMIYLYSHLGNFAINNAPLSSTYYRREQDYKDSIVAMITPADRDYMWYRGWEVLATDMPEKKSLMDSLRHSVDASPMSTREDAMDAYILARLCRDEGLDDEYVKYMTASAIADIRSSNRDIASVEELAKFLFDKGDLDHANNYINFALQAAIRYPNRVRTIGMAEVFDEITRAYQERDSRQVARIHFYLILVCVLSLILIISIIVIILQMRKVRIHARKLDAANRQLNINVEDLQEAHAEISRVNSQLNEVNAKLSETNEDLMEANYLKEEYLAYVFAICSKYIKKNEDFRKTVGRKCKARQYDDIKKLAEATSVAKDELREFFHDFDSIFLKIYPDFVEDFNALLQPEERIIPKDGELLNTELRIYALVRLGISDSVKIAEFLHCSPQTVYNNRFRVRAKSHIAKEDFASTVQSLGKGKLTPPAE